MIKTVLMTALAFAAVMTGLTLIYSCNIINILFIAVSFFAAIMAGLAYVYSVQDKSRKRFIWNTARQIPYLIGRYMA
jgi:hypothetical protein